MQWINGNLQTTEMFDQTPFCFFIFFFFLLKNKKIKKEWVGVVVVVEGEQKLILKNAAITSTIFFTCG